MQITDQELLGAARQTLNMARVDWELQGWPTGIVIASYHVKDNPPLHRMRKIEKLLQDRLGKDWLNYDDRKDHGLHVLRLSTLIMPPDAMVITAPTNAWKPTAKFKFRGDAARKATETQEQLDQLAAEGRMELVDSVVATGQTPERVCICVQPVARGGVYIGEPTTVFFNQAGFVGRLKMFGGEVDERWREEAVALRKAFEERGATAAGEGS